jgi:hypothetical protein
VEDASHHVIIGQHVVWVERVDDALLGLTVWTGAGDTAQHEETEVVSVDGKVVLSSTNMIFFVLFWCF